MQICYTPEFNKRLRIHYEESGHIFHREPPGEINTELEILSDQDMLLAWIGWTDETRITYVPGEEFYDKWGVLRRVVGYKTPFGNGTYNELVGHPLADISKLPSYKIPDAENPGLYTGVDGLLRDYKDEYWIVGVAVTTMYETAWALRGFEQMFIDFVENPDIIDAIFGMTMNYHLSIARNLVKRGVDMIWIGDDVGSQNRMLISPQTWRRFFREKMAYFISSLREINSGIKIAYHSDGYIIPIIPDLIEIGIDILNPVQPASMNPVEVRRISGDRLCLWGTIDEQNTLPFGSPEKIKAEIACRINTVGRKGGLILSPTHNLQLDTPLENYFAMVEAIKEPCKNYLAGTPFSIG
jgi:uroporphyrinogen-III decarboxylase